MFEAKRRIDRFAGPKRIDSVVNVVIDINIIITDFKLSCCIFFFRLRKLGKIRFQSPFGDNLIIGQILTQSDRTLLGKIN